MGPCCSVPDVEEPGSQILVPTEIEATLPDASQQKVFLASASYCYCLLISKAASFVDLRSKDDFNENHLCGGWSLQSLLSRKESEAAGALKSLCDFRRVVIISTDGLKDPYVMKFMSLLRQAAHPSQLLAF